MMNAYLVHNTQDRWSKLLGRARMGRLATGWLMLVGACMPLTAADPLPGLVKSYRENPNARARTALVAYAHAHAGATNGALASFALGVVAYQQKDAAAARSYLVQARAGAARLSDYIDYYEAAASSLSPDTRANVPAQLNHLKPFLTPLSPLAARAALLDAKAISASSASLQDEAPALVRLLKENYAALPQPETDLALAYAYDASDDRKEAATYYQRVYFGYPATEAAADASSALERLKVSLGTAYPAPTPAQLLLRGDRWLTAKQYGKAKQEFDTVAGQLSGIEKEQAQVRAGAARYLDGDADGAYSYLRELHFSHNEADAERLYYMAEAARKLKSDENLDECVKHLGQHHAQSVWRLKTLVNAGNHYLVTNEPARYEPLYKAAYKTFAPDNSTAYCHWKVSWDAYMARQKDVGELLREQITKYPFDPKAATALYFLGRIAENEKNYAVARACYNKLVDTYPHYYYAVLARERVAEGDLSSAAPDEKTTEWLSGLEFPTHERMAIEEPTAATKLRIEKTRLLIAAGFPDFAESEVRFAARVDGQAHLLAMETARLSPSTFQSLRRMKAVSGDYLALGFECAPPQFWQMLFPLPWQKDLLTSAKHANLDPFLVAALIRQESEFNASALSHANAYGLTQIVPATGRALAKQEGIRAFNANLLFNPALNLKLGSVYIRTLLDQWNGKWEETLASYNAGRSRVLLWNTWHDYREPAEFVESIPFTETREYVQAVMRNAAIYREIYSGNMPQPEREEPVAAIPVVRRASTHARSGKVRVVKARHAVKHTNHGGKAHAKRRSRSA